MRQDSEWFSDDHDETHKWAARAGALVLGKRKQSRARRTVDDSSRAAPERLLPGAGTTAVFLAPAWARRSRERHHQERVDGSHTGAAPTSTVLASESAALGAAALS